MEIWYDSFGRKTGFGHCETGGIWCISGGFPGRGGGEGTPAEKAGAGPEPDGRHAECVYLPRFQGQTDCNHQTAASCDGRDCGADSGAGGEIRSVSGLGTGERPAASL